MNRTREILKILLQLKVVVFRHEHLSEPKFLDFIPLSETTTIPDLFKWEVHSPWGGLTILNSSTCTAPSPDAILERFFCVTAFALRLLNLNLSQQTCTALASTVNAKQPLVFFEMQKFQVQVRCMFIQGFISRNDSYLHPTNDLGYIFDVWNFGASEPQVPKILKVT